MPDIEIRPATAEHFADVERALTGGGDSRTCQCQWWRLTNAEWNVTDAADRERLLRAEVAAGPPPALVAYVADEAAGWVRVGPRDAQTRLARTKAVVAASLEEWGDPSVWSVSCFVVRKEHRRTGLTARLLHAAIAYAREGGARVIEAYPIDPAVRKIPASGLFTGVLSTFDAAGFREVARAKPHQAIVTFTVE